MKKLVFLFCMAIGINSLVHAQRWKLENIQCYVLNEQTSCAVPVYRFYSTVSQDHFFTASGEELNAVLQKIPEYKFEGVAYYAFSEAGEGRVPLYRFYVNKTKAHFYTTSEEEKKAVEKMPGYQYEKIECYVFAEKKDKSVPLYRLFNGRLHHYTAWEGEKDAMLK